VTKSWDAEADYLENKFGLNVRRRAPAQDGLKAEVKYLKAALREVVEERDRLREELSLRIELKEKIGATNIPKYDGSFLFYCKECGRRSFTDGLCKCGAEKSDIRGVSATV
jgi:hypothetical protein